MIYVDELINFGWKIRGRKVKNCHLLCDNSVDDLITFANKIGLKAEYLQRSADGTPHYDLVESKRKLAIINGAKELTKHEWYKIRNKFKVK